MRRCLALLSLALPLLACCLAVPAHADPLRVGKSASTVFSYTLLDLGIQQGIFAKHGLEIDAVGFGGGPRLMQALVAGSEDMGIGTGPDIVMVAKGAPVKFVGVLAGRPDELSLVVAHDSTIHAASGLKGARIGVTAVASLTGWLTRQISLDQGWGPDGIKLVQVANGAASMALLKTGQIDGLAQDTLSCFEAERVGFGRVLLNFGPVAPHFIIQGFFATDALIAAHPERVRAFLAGWYETVAFARAHKAETVATVARILQRDPDLTARTYDLLRNDWSVDGRLDPKALDVLAHSYVDLGLLDTPPDMRRFTTEEFLPK